MTGSATATASTTSTPSTTASSTSSPRSAVHATALSSEFFEAREELEGVDGLLDFDEGVVGVVAGLTLLAEVEVRAGD